MQPALRQHLKKSKIQFKVQFATEFLTEKQFSNLKIPFEVQSVTEKQTEFFVVYFSSAAGLFRQILHRGIVELALFLFGSCDRDNDSEDRDHHDTAAQKEIACTCLGAVKKDIAYYPAV